MLPLLFCTMLAKSVRITLLVLAGLLAQCLVFWPSYDGFMKQPSYQFEGEPLLTTPDAYYFLRHAEEASKGEFVPKDELRPYAMPEELSLLSELLVFTSDLTDTPLRTTAFYLAPALAALMVLISIGLGLTVGSRLIGFISFLFGACVPAWYTRTLPGNFDTDGLNQLFFWAGMVFGYQALRGNKLKRIACALGWLLSNIMLNAWWPQAGYSFVPLGLGFIIFGYIIEKKLYARKWLWLTTAASGLLALLLVVFLPHLPMGLRLIVLELTQHINLILGQSNELFLSTGKSIAELSNLSPAKMVEQTTGHWILFIVVLFGCVDMLRRRLPSAWYFLPPTVFFFAIAFFAGNRFLMFCAPIVGLCIAWFLLRTAPDLLERYRFSRVAILLLGFVFLAIAYQYPYNFHLGVASDKYAAELARSYQTKSSPEGKTWNWWGPGYFIQYFADRETFIDGGSQTSERAFIAAVPYASKNPMLAKNWIKFFAANPNGISFMTRVLKQKEKAVEFLLEILGDPARFDEIIKKYNLPKTRNWEQYLFPSEEVYLFIKHDMLFHGSWYPIGAWRPDNETKLMTTTFAYDQAYIDREKGTVKLNDGEIVEYSKLYFVTPKSLSHDPVREEGPIAIVMEGIQYIIIVPQEFFNVMTFKLLFVNPLAVEGVVPIAFHPYVGGVWRIY